MKDYLGSDVASAMKLIRALTPPPAPPAPAAAPALGAKAPMARKGGGMLKGPGDGRSDSIPAALGNGPAAEAVRVSDGEFVIPADVVSALGRGSSDAGSRKLTDMVLGVRKDYRAHLGGLGKPQHGRGDKGLGGFFGSEQEAKIERPKNITDIEGRTAQLLRGVWASRNPADDVAGFTPDQTAAMNMGRDIATGDPYGTDSAYWSARGIINGNQQNFDAGQANLATQQGRVAGAQDMLSGQSNYLNQAQDDLGVANWRLNSQYGNLDAGQAELGRASDRVDQQYGRLDTADGGLDKASGRVDSQYGYLDQAQGGLGTQRGQVAGAQGYLNEILGGGGDNQKLIDATLNSFDYQRSKDVADAARKRAGRGAFGERRAIAEDEESVASNLARAGIEADLRDKAVSRRMDAASGIGSLAQTGTGIETAAGGLAGQAGDLASSQGKMATDRGALAGIGGDLAGTQGQLATGRASLTNSAAGLAAGQTDVAGTRGSLVNSATGVAAGIGDLAGTSGDLTTRSGNLATQNIDAASQGASLASQQRDVGLSNVGLLQGIGDTEQAQNQKVLDAPYNRVAIGNQFRSGAPSAVTTSSSPGLGQTLLGIGATAAGAYAGSAKDGGRIKDVRAKAKAKGKRYAQGGMVQQDQQVQTAIGQPQQQQPMAQALGTPVSDMRAAGATTPAQAQQNYQQWQQTQAQPTVTPKATMGMPEAQPQAAPVQQPAQEQPVALGQPPQQQQAIVQPVAAAKPFGNSLGGLPAASPAGQTFANPWQQNKSQGQAPQPYQMPRWGARMPGKFGFADGGKLEFKDFEAPVDETVHGASAYLRRRVAFREAQREQAPALGSVPGKGKPMAGEPGNMSALLLKQGQKFADGGMLEPGNIDLNRRPKHRNPDGSISTVRSMSFENDKGQEVLVPTVLGRRGKTALMSDEAAMKEYGRTGQHLGIFENPKAADAYAQKLHKDQEAMYVGNGRKGYADGGEVSDYYIRSLGISSPLAALVRRGQAERESMQPVKAAGPQFPISVDKPLPERPMTPRQAMEALGSKRTPPMASNDEFNAKLDSFRAANGGGLGDALGLNYLGPDADGAGGRPGIFERRAMRDNAAPQSPAPEKYPTAAVEKPFAGGKGTLADRTKEIIARGMSKPPQAAGALGSVVPATRPGTVMQAPAQKQAALGGFMPEMKTRGPEPAAETPPPAAEGPSWRDRVEGALTNPLTQFGLALLADDGSSGFAGAIGKAGLGAAQQVVANRRAESEAAKEARAEKLALRKLGLSEAQAQAYIENQRSLQADRIADNERQTANDAAAQADRDRRFAAEQDYRGKSLGIQNAGLDLRRQAEARLAKGAAGTGGDPTNRIVLQKLREQLGAALGDPMADPEEADRLRQQIAALESSGGDAEGLGALPPGFEFDDPALRDGGMVRGKKKRAC